MHNIVPVPHVVEAVPQESAADLIDFLQGPFGKMK
jgi:hypothetical protein